MTEPLQTSPNNIDYFLKRIGIALINTRPVFRVTW